jgi:hypothetical protein
MVPRREFEPLAEPARQPDVLEAYRRQRPHEDIVIEFTGSTMSDLAIAIIAGFNWLNHCAVLAGADRDKFSGTLSNFRKLAGLRSDGGRWKAPASAAARCWRKAEPPLMLYLIWTEYTRLAKEVAAAAFFGSSIERRSGPGEALKSNLPGAPTSSTPLSTSLRKPWPVSSAPAIPTI